MSNVRTRRTNLYEERAFTKSPDKGGANSKYISRPKNSSYYDIGIFRGNERYPRRKHSRKYASNHLLKESFFNLNKTLQIKCNKDFELLAYLCLEIPKLILGNFFFSLDQFLYCKIPNINEYTNIPYSNEVEIFSNNIKLICEIFIYLSSCKEVFELLVKKVEQMNITSKLFKIIEQFLHFTRYYSSRIINMSQTYIEKTIQDKNFLIKIEEEAQLIPTTKKQHIDILSKIHDKERIFLVTF